MKKWIPLLIYLGLCEVRSDIKKAKEQVNVANRVRAQQVRNMIKKGSKEP